MLGNGLATTLIGFAATTLVWSIADLILLGRLYSLIAEIAPAQARARYFATFGLVWGIAAIIGPTAGTAVIARFGPTTLWAGCAGLCLALAGVQPLIRRHLWPTGRN